MATGRAGERERELAERRRRREQDRSARAAAERERRAAAYRGALEARRAAAHARAAALGADAATAGLGREQVALLIAARTQASVIGAADGHTLARVDRDIQALEEAVDRLAAGVGAFLATHQRHAALDAARALLATEPDRERLDPGGSATVAARLAQAQAVVRHVTRFAAAHRDLTGAVTGHLHRARRRGRELAAMRRDGDEITRALGLLLDEVAAAGADLPGPDAARGLLRDLAAALAAEDTLAAAQHVGAGWARHTQVAAALDAWQDERDRTALVLDALAGVLPGLGLAIVPGSHRTVGTGTTLVAR